ncbi:GNAT family N-acetyltransferase [Bacillus alkalicellulosilyticus]|uniref:GNAT family N-acetyltransferase n=1 Tax=Alkalihalobacterium alkalicellulosilyticum TaxID=1912214 RepID=UPI001FE35457|nr:GNAT family N-acetyltransferase [Bacillus alkalicellulosilyticus]
MNIRRATEMDYEPLAKLMITLGYPTTKEEMRTRLHKISKHHDYETFVAEEGTHVIGMVGICLQLSYETNHTYVRIISMVVEENCRKQGVGKKLLEVVQGWAKERGSSAIVLNSGNRTERQSAHAFYQKLGFIGKSTGYYKLIY